MKKKFSTCYKTLVELGVERKNMIFLFNKSESIDNKKILHIMNNLKIDEIENSLDISALTGKNLDELNRNYKKDFMEKLNKMKIERIGQRVIRDDRVTTHVALVARAFGASKIYMNEVDPEIENTIKRMNKTWGGEFEVEFFEDWKKVLNSKIKEYKIVHLTMYGEKLMMLQKRLEKIRIF